MHFTEFWSRPGQSLLVMLHIPMVAALSIVPASGRDVGNAAAGHRMAKTWCDSCHVVDSAQKSGTSNGAPPFTAIAKMKTTTFTGLEVFLQRPHDRMPDLHLSHEEIDDVAAYILSLKR